MRPLLLALALTASACAAAPVPRPAPPAVAGVEHRDERFPGKDGVDLFAQSWRPAAPRGAIVLVHGLKDHGTRYAELAQRLAADGLAVHALDLRGHGRSAGERAFAADLGEYVADLAIYVERVRASNPGAPLLLFGHSMGGAIATTYTLEHPVDGLILSAAALQLGPEVSPGLVKLTRKLGRKHPHWRVLKLKPKYFSRDPAVVADVNGADPQVDTRKIPASTAAGLIAAIDRIQADMEKLTVPVLILHGEDDRITPPDGSRNLHRRAGARDKQLVIVPGAYHDLLHEPDHAAVLAAIDAFVAARLAASTPAPDAATASPASP